MQPTLTIATATYRDHMGVFFTMTSLRNYLEAAGLDKLVSLLVVDNDPHASPTSETAMFCAQSGIRYIHAAETVGTSYPRNVAVSNAITDYVMVIDSHVLLKPGSIEALLYYLDEHHPTDDLIHGPLVYHNGYKHDCFAPVWRDEMLGVWAMTWLCQCRQYAFVVVPKPIHVTPDSQCYYLPATLHNMTIPASEQDYISNCPTCGSEFPRLPFIRHEAELERRGYVPQHRFNNVYQIPAGPLGLFVVRRDSWLGFPKHARGFGGEEVCVHYAYYKTNRNVICLSQLQWQHYFGPRCERAPVRKFDKVRNYVLYFTELGLPLDSIYNHFVRGDDNSLSSRLSQKDWEYIMTDPLHHTESTAQPQQNQVPSNPTQPQSNQTGGCKPCGSQQNQALSSWNAWAGQALLATVGSKDQEAYRMLLQTADTLAALLSDTQQVYIVGSKADVILLALLARVPADTKLTVVYRLPRVLVWPNVQDDRISLLQAQTPVAAPDDAVLVLAVADQNELAQLVAKTERPIRIAVVGVRQYADTAKQLLADFAATHREYTLTSFIAAGVGLAVLSRLAKDKKRLPGVWTQAKNYFKFLLRRWVLGTAKTLPVATVAARLKICAACESRVGERCGECGCYLDQGPAGTLGRAWFDKPGCPLGKWEIL
ncbi:MAG: glycosyltransferase family A protein [Candidatus Caldarchaeum sp.]